MEPLNNGHVGTSHFVHCRAVAEVYIGKLKGVLYMAYNYACAIPVPVPTSALVKVQLVPPVCHSCNKSELSTACRLEQQSRRVSFSDATAWGLCGVVLYGMWWYD